MRPDVGDQHGASLPFLARVAQDNIGKPCEIAVASHFEIIAERPDFVALHGLGGHVAEHFY
jgi:hypothetical protein